ncbi:SDR family oxidoreductase [Paraferrimonas haliotis]|uniref:3-ketoacyl-ACP reductase n=1 Tax=Paraferrimonas haliotis TaxID=2013866 RepID=A0AA37TUC4_9GAMM|nr:SDR family oxidoreductase [Paraferrimonas haliotis]GLS84331.1 3-ketoacyl-ACP reductase [Paraferrimonas haliotis]
MQVNESVIVITGGARGLGFAMAESFANAGAKLAIIDADEQALNKAVGDIGSSGAEVQGYCVDITDEELISDTFNYILEDFGKISVLINNAGILRDGMLVKAKDGQITDKMSLSQFNSVINVNLVGSFLCGREAAAAMIKSNQQGLIINMSSIARAGNMGQSNYAASKAGVAAMTTTWASELARHNIRSVAIAPGVIETEMTAAMKPQMLDRLVNMVPVGRLGLAEEIAHTARYIVENDYVNGTVIEVNGGLKI